MVFPRYFTTQGILAALLLRAGQAFVVHPTSSSPSLNRAGGITPPYYVPQIPPLYSASTTVQQQGDVESMRAGEIKKELESYGISTKAFLEKEELVEALMKARADGLEPIDKTVETGEESKRQASSSGSTSSSPSTTSSASSSSSDKTTRPREERLKEELVKCQAMKASELKKELEERGVNTKTFFEKSEFVKALAQARVDGVQKRQNNNNDQEGYAEYTNVEVLTDDASGPRSKKADNTQQRSSSIPFGGGANPFGGGGASSVNGSPFGDIMGGGMGGIADMLKNMGVGGGTAAGGGANPFAGSGSTNPFAGGADVMGKAQQMMSNPKVQEIMRKAQSNPRVMAKLQECMGNPAAMLKYQNDPDVASLIAELKQYM